MLWRLAWSKAWLLRLCSLHLPPGARPLSWCHVRLHYMWGPGPCHRLHRWLHWSSHPLWLLWVNWQAVHVDSVVLLVLLGLSHHLNVPGHFNGGQRRLLLLWGLRLGLGLRLRRLGERRLLLV